MKNHRKYTHSSILPANMLCSSQQLSVVSWKCLQLWYNNTKGNHKIKIPSSFNVAETEESHFGTPECFAIVFSKTRAYWNLSCSEFHFVPFTQVRIHLDILSLFLLDIHWHPLNVEWKEPPGSLWAILLPLAKSHPRENEGVFFPEKVPVEEPTASLQASRLLFSTVFERNSFRGGSWAMRKG